MSDAVSWPHHTRRARIVERSFDVAASAVAILLYIIHWTMMGIIFLEYLRSKQGILKLAQIVSIAYLHLCHVKISDYRTRLNFRVSFLSIIISFYSSLWIVTGTVILAQKQHCVFVCAGDSPCSVRLCSFHVVQQFLRLRFLWRGHARLLHHGRRFSIPDGIWGSEKDTICKLDDSREYCYI